MTKAVRPVLSFDNFGQTGFDNQMGLFAAGGGWNASRAAAGMATASAGSGLFVPDPLESDKCLDKYWASRYDVV